MFDSLSEKLTSSLRKLGSKGKLSEKDIDEALKQIRLSLIAADVNVNVVKDFLENIKTQAMGEEVSRSLTPGQSVVKIVNSELTKLLGTKAVDINYSAMPPTVILMAGVQGSGKTTSAAKLALYLKNKNKKVLLAACDTHRLAAREQLSILGNMVGVEVIVPSSNNAQMAAIEALRESRKRGCEVLIIDTAGRQHVNDELMSEIKQVADSVKPKEVFFTIDCLMGQMAVDSAVAFDKKVGITGYILTKSDSDARGGAALSVTYVTGKPIKFIGTGEKPSDFEVFHPDRIAGRILGMGDILSAIEKAEKTIDAKQQAELAKKLTTNAFTLSDFLDQIENMEKMGGVSAMMASLPGNMKMAKGADISQSEKQLKRTKAIIQSMTVKERNNPAIINASRRKRIAAGSGVTVTDVNRVLSQYEQMKKMFKQFGSGKKGNKARFPFM